jgi:hypothetical protein
VLTAPPPLAVVGGVEVGAVVAGVGATAGRVVAGFGAALGLLVAVFCWGDGLFVVGMELVAAEAGRAAA